MRSNGLVSVIRLQTLGCRLREVLIIKQNMQVIIFQSDIDGTKFHHSWHDRIIPAFS